MDASDSPNASEGAVTQFIRNLQQSRGNGIEEVVLDFEDNSTESNFKYLVDSENGNPLDVGLRSIDAMSKVVSGKNASGIGQFNSLPSITVNTIQKSTAEELVPFILETLGMTTPVTEGLKNGRGDAIGFSILSKAIAQELKRGGEIYNKFISDVKASGRSTIREWINSGNR